MLNVDNPSSCRQPTRSTEIASPSSLRSILVPEAHVGAVMKLCIDKRGVQKKMQYLGGQTRWNTKYHSPKSCWISSTD